MIGVLCVLPRVRWWVAAALLIGGCGIGISATTTPTTPTPAPQPTAVARRPVPTVTPTTTARPAYLETPRPERPRRGRKRGAVVAPSGGGRKPAPTPTPTAPPPVGEPYAQLRAAYHVEGAPVRPTLGWRFRVAGGVSAPPAVSDGVVYFGTIEGDFYALDSRTGLERWTYRTGGWIQSAPEVADEAVLVGSDDGSLYALEKRSGRLLWRRRLGGEVRGPVTVSDGTVYAGTTAGDLYAVDASRGRVRWRYASGAPITGRPAVAGRTVIGANLDGDLFVLDTATGKRRGSTRGLASSSGASVAVGRGLVLAASSSGALSAVDARTGRVRWRAPVGSGASTTPAVVDSGVGGRGRGAAVVVAAAEGGGSRVSALRLANGRRLWSRRLRRARTSSSPAVVGGAVYVGAKDGYLYALDARTGAVSWRFRTRNDVDSSPVVAGGRAYFGSWDGYFYAVGAPAAAEIPLPPVANRDFERDAPGDVRGARSDTEIRAAGASYGTYGAAPGIAFEMRLGAPAPTRARKQTAYVWALDYTLDTQIDYYIFLDLTKGAREYKATLERATPNGLRTVNDKLPLLVEGSSVRVFLPISPYLSAREEQPVIDWYAYSYVEKLPARDELSDRGRYFRLTPEP